MSTTLMVDVQTVGGGQAFGAGAGAVAGAALMIFWVP